MEHEPTGPLRMRVETEKWPLVAPFRMTGQTLDAAEVLVVVLENDDFACGFRFIPAGYSDLKPAIVPI